MGQSIEGAGAAPEQEDAPLARVEGPRLDLGSFTAERATRVVEVGPATIVVRGMTRAQFVDLGIDEHTDERDDEARIVAATVVEPKASAEEWRAAIERMDPGTASIIIGAVMAENGLSGEVGRQLARDFRS